MRLPGHLPRLLVLLCLLPGRAAVASHDLPTDPETGRWYSAVQLEQGRAIFAANCAGCHGDRAQGQPRWEERDESGYYPAPPLDGTAHSANHPIEQMLRTLDTGGGPMGGTMPSYMDILSDGEKRAVIAWVQSLWPNGVYDTWRTTVHDE